RSAAAPAPVTADFATVDGTATAGSDYVAGSGTLSFAPGETTKTVTVSVVGDLAHEADETFFVDLSHAAGVAIVRSRGVGTIVDDDAATAPLTLEKSGTGTGSVTSAPAGIDCGPSCATQSHSFASGTLLTLTAVPATGSLFAGWSGGGCSGIGQCALQLDADTTVTATFRVQVQEGPTFTVDTAADHDDG